MKVITSKENTLYKNTSKLLRKKYRDETGLYLLEGVKPLMDALETGIKIEKVFVCDGTGIGWIGLPEVDVIGLARPLFDKLSDTVASQGVIAVARRQVLTPEDFARRVHGRNLVVLDRLQDPGNVGTIIRTAEAAGFAGVIAIGGSADPYSPKVVRSAAGSLFRVPVLTGLDGQTAVRMLREMDTRIAVTAMEGSTSYLDTDFRAPVAVVIGNEGQGVGLDFLEHADLTVRIPMAGKIDSLNAAVAAGILMYRAAGCENINER